MAWLIGGPSPKLAVIDGDSLLHMAGYATQKVTASGEVVTESFNNAIFLVEKAIEGIMTSTGSTDFELHINGDDNFRYRVAKYAPYKGNRKEIVRPAHLPTLIKWASFQDETRIVDGMESDDSSTIAYLAHEGDAVLCHIDKDLNQVPGEHYGWNKRQTYTVSAVEGHRAFWSQVLTGDTSDNIVGLEDIGPAWAKDILHGADSYDAMHRRVQDFYIAELGEVDGVSRYQENAKLLWMLRQPGAVWNNNWQGL